MHKIKNTFLLITFLFLSGCITTGPIFTKPETPKQWDNYQSSIIQKEEVQALGNWWKNFEDPALNQLIQIAFSDSPDRRIAETRILEARGIRRSATGSLFPKIGITGSAGRQDDALNVDNYYEAGFDASYELDIFGKNRKTANAADENLNRLKAEYHNVTLSLIAEITRDYIDYRTFQKQVKIADKNLIIQEKTLKLVRTQKEFGEAPQLDVERAENLVNTTKSSIPEFKRQATNAKLRLSILTGHLPKKLEQFLAIEADIPDAEVTPVLLAPADVISLRPDIRAAISNLNAATSLAEAATTDLFPNFTLSGFFGVADNALVSSTTIWSVAIGAAVNLIDFGRIRGRIDAARALELRAYESYRRTILEAITEVETALNDYARINEQYIHLQSAYANAEKALELSRLLYAEGETAFIDVLESQRTLNDSDAALVSSMSAKSQSLIRLYKSLGVY